MKKFIKPTIKKLSECFAHSKQCMMFSMPKRSCKGLPSAIFEKNKK